MKLDELRSNSILRGPVFPEPVQVIVATPLGDAVKPIGQRIRSGEVHEPILSDQQLLSLAASPEREPFDRDAHRFPLRIKAMRQHLAFESRPYFSLSIPRVDLPPHQLEAVTAPTHVSV